MPKKPPIVYAELRVDADAKLFLGPVNAEQKC